MDHRPDKSFLEKSRGRVLIAPSLLACDFSRLAGEIGRAQKAGADLFHLDVMDGHFVPNITVGPLVMQAIRPHAALPVEAHLMISDPVEYAARFARAGADAVTFHVEAADDPVSAALKIRGLGVACGVSLNPATPLERIAPLKGLVDYVLVMTVVPGFGGQKFMPGPLEKVRAVASEWGTPVGVDGGIGVDTAAAAAGAGARILVAGTAVFGHDDLEGRISAVRRAAGEA